MIFREGDILILGAQGLLGSELTYRFKKTAIGLTHSDIEILAEQDCKRIFEKYRPKVIINAAALVRSEGCESSPQSCIEMNSIGPLNIARAGKHHDAVIVHFSTDYVFDGNKKFFTEYDITNPINIYGAAKEFSETLIKITTSKHYIIRSSWFFGTCPDPNRVDFPRRMLAEGKKYGEIRVVNDQHGSPTFIKDLSQKIKELLENEAPYGIYHITNAGYCTWYEYAKKCFDLAGVNYKVHPITTQDSGTLLKRPAYSILKNTRLQEEKYPPMRSWEEALAEYISQIK